MIDWAGCTTVMIGLPSPKTFPPILNHTCMCPAEVWAAGERSGWGYRHVRAIERSSWSNSDSETQSSRLGEKESSHSRRMTFRRATGVTEMDVRVSTFCIKTGDVLPP